MPLFGKKKPEKKPMLGEEISRLPPAAELKSIRKAVQFPAAELPELPEMPSARLTPPGEFLGEEKTKAAIIPEAPKMLEVPFETPSARAEMPSRPFIREMKPKFREPIFVKIEKFREAIESLEIINKRIRELIGLMEKIKETRAKEEEEIARWEKEIEDIKNRLIVIDQKLFSRLE